MNYLDTKRIVKHLIFMVLLCLPNVFLHADDTEIYLNIDADQCGAPAEKYRFIFILDNSGSMSSTEFTQSKSTIDATIQAVLASGLPDLKVAVVQYGTNHDDEEHKYDVTVPFTNVETTALTWGREFGSGTLNPRDFQDHLPASLARMRDENVYASGGALDLEDATNVQVVFFTDAWRAGSVNWNQCCSDLVGGSTVADETNNGDFTTDTGFGEFNRFKDGSLLVNNAGVGIEAQFTVLNTNSRSDAQGAAAAIASPGGSWNGVVEANSGDPEGSQTKPRRFIHGSFSQSDTTQLVELVEEVIEELKATTFSQVAPAVAVNAFNQLQHRNDIYYSIFKPIQSPRWDGNVKKYFITADPEIQDQDGNAAIDNTTGSIKETALSYWSGGVYPAANADDICGTDSDSCTGTTDGAEVVVGGFREQLTNARTVFTDGTSLECHLESPVPAGCSTGIIQISASSEIQHSLLGLSTTVSTPSGEVEPAFTILDRGTATGVLEYNGTSGTLLYDDSCCGGNWLNSERAKTGVMSSYGITLADSYEFSFSIQDGRDQFVLGFESQDYTVLPTTEIRDTINLGFFFRAGGKMNLYINGAQAPFDSGVPVDGNDRIRYNPDDVFRFVINGANHEIYQNDVLISSGSSALTAGTDYFVEVAGRERLQNGEDVYLHEFKLLQAGIGGTVTTTEGDVSRSDLLSWLTGIDVFNDDEDSSLTDANNFVSDSLHARPVVVTYGGTATNPLDVIFHSTNVGVLHAVKAGNVGQANDTGTELWSYIPEELLSNPVDYILDDDLVTDHTYGLDADITVWTERADIGDTPSQVYLYMGQRRGGRNYFALNATNASGQTLPAGAQTCTTVTDKVCRLFTLSGGITPGFAALGETWGKPIRTKINTSCSLDADNRPVCTTKDVLILSGGYDDKYDDDTKTLETIEAEGVLGNHIYIVDAITGDLLWSAGETDPGTAVTGDYFLPCDGSVGSACTATMNHSFVSSPAALDMDRDGAIDTMFAIDIAGRVWRFDFRATSTEDDGLLTIQTSAAGIIADLSATGVKRRFYNRLDVVITPSSATMGEAKFNLITGSGYRAHPKEVESAGNNFYIIYDENIFAPEFDSSNKAEYDYYDVSTTTDRRVVGTDIAFVDATLSPFNPLTTHKHGFYVELTDRDEHKVLNPTLTTDFKVLGVGYLPAPTVSTTDACALGSSEIYVIDLLTGGLTTFALQREGIVAEGILLYLLDDKSTADEHDDELRKIVCFGTECLDSASLGVDPNVDLGKATKMYWWEKDREN